jgi:FMN phosphatase YigB (HAD superfamily)
MRTDKIDSMPFLSRFDAVIFDLNGTLAEQYDRFGDDQNYYATYVRLGGRGLTADAVHGMVKESLRKCLTRYELGPWDPFPPYGDFVDLEDPAEKRLVEDTVANHELGVVPDSTAAWLRGLARTHRIGLVSDVWGPAGSLRTYLSATGLASLFGAIVLSSEEGAVKPSPRLFRAAVERLGCEYSSALFVGDSLTRDIAGAKGCGLATVWIGNRDRLPEDVRPDRVIGSVEELSLLD